MGKGHNYITPEKGKDNTMASAKNSWENCYQNDQVMWLYLFIKESSIQNSCLYLLKHIVSRI